VTITYRARCPECGNQATFHAEQRVINSRECSEITRIVCTCAPTDPKPLVSR
jgi:hypothetical protein